MCCRGINIKQNEKQDRLFDNFFVPLEFILSEVEGCGFLCVREGGAMDSVLQGMNIKQNEKQNLYYYE